MRATISAPHSGCSRTRRRSSSVSRPGFARMCGGRRSLPTSWSSAPSSTSTSSARRQPEPLARRPSRWPRPRASGDRCRRPPRPAPSPARGSRPASRPRSTPGARGGDRASPASMPSSHSSSISRDSSFRCSSLPPTHSAPRSSSPQRKGAAATAPSPAACRRRPIRSGSVPAPATAMKPPGVARRAHHDPRLRRTRARRMRAAPGARAPRSNSPAAGATAPLPAMGRQAPALCPLPGSQVFSQSAVKRQRRGRTVPLEVCGTRRCALRRRVPCRRAPVEAQPRRGAAVDVDASGR